MTNHDAPPLPILAGPTAVGKSALALAWSRRHRAEILSADSMQVYRGMAIGTAQPFPDELAAVRHHLVGHVDPGEEYNVARFVREADAILGAASSPILVCGGTGLFLRHLIQGIFEGAPRDPAIRAKLESELAATGLDALRARLRAVDPVREAQINANDSVRVVRALEVYETTGRPMSEHHAEDAATRTIRPARYVVLTRPREALMRRIDMRVDAMIDAGWLDEARGLFDRRLPEDTQAAKALGYRELFRHLRGECGLATAVAEIKNQTRRFAKRQLTWFRGVRDAIWIDIEGLEPTEALERVERAFD